MHAVQRAIQSKVKYGDNVMLLAALRYYRCCHIRHVKAHMDKRTPATLLSADHIGNITADLVAGNKVTANITVSDSFIATRIVSALQFYIRDSTTCNPLLESLKRRLSRYRMRRYL
jgi:hypothetical protein